MNDIHAYMACTLCLEEDREPALAVGVTMAGDLVVWCLPHDVQVARMANDKVADELLRVVVEPCDHCGEKETGH